MAVSASLGSPRTRESTLPGKITRTGNCRFLESAPGLPDFEFDCHSPPHNEVDQLTFEYLAYAALRHADLATIPLDLMT